MCNVGRQNFKIFVRWVKKIKTHSGRQWVSDYLSVSFVFHFKFIIPFSLSICCVVVFSPLVHNSFIPTQNISSNNKVCCTSIPVVNLHNIFN